LKSHGLNVTVFEAEGRAGGKLRSVSHDGLIWDEGANTMVNFVAADWNDHESNVEFESNSNGGFVLFRLKVKWRSEVYLMILDFEKSNNL
jgi:hypothetical protein